MVITLFISAAYFGYPLSLETHKDPGLMCILATSFLFGEEGGMSTA